ncbi:hypothetical protein PV08_02694 [Exophiala spinifera]|uniref:Uncharacterized protein n=1 Tax=Exophiala spinifera TaxID=91928 RepID=A0A0D1YSY4_9EURO|nr:uncharacterized protein PV08_02694 [Exophiala spinifera]KIW18406.1 hypothetical protein PV08_02694 [Exophiala spinifera]
MGLDDNHYRSVSDEDETFPLAPPEKEPPKSGWGKQSILLSIATATLFVAVIAAVLSTVGSAVVTYKSNSSDAVATATQSAAASTATSAILDGVSEATESKDEEVEIQGCGSNPTEARANGCVFDVMMQLWTPAACYDRTLSDRFLEEGNWTWYADTSATKVWTLDEMRKGEHDAVYVAQEYHITHCIYAWEMLVRALRNQAPIITELISYDHVIHCRHKTLQRADGGSSIRGVRAPTGYTSCAPYNTWKHHLPANQHSSTD